MKYHKPQEKKNYLPVTTTPKTAHLNESIPEGIYKPVSGEQHRMLVTRVEFIPPVICILCIQNGVIEPMNDESTEEYIQAEDEILVLDVVKKGGYV